MLQFGDGQQCKQGGVRAAAIHLYEFSNDEGLTAPGELFLAEGEYGSGSRKT